jgi:hypothetical protein
VVDAAGRIHTQVLGDRLNAAQLGEPLRELLGRAPLPQQLRLGNLIERVRILCTVYDPDTGAYRYDYKLILEIRWRDVRRRRLLSAEGAIAARARASLLSGWRPSTALVRVGSA